LWVNSIVLLEALNGLSQAAKRRARGFASVDTIRTVIFVVAGKLDFAAIDATPPTFCESRLADEPQTARGGQRRRASGRSKATGEPTVAATSRPLQRVR
jgi:hypothetical protein